MCKILHVSRSGYYVSTRRKPSSRALRQTQLTEHIRHAHQQSMGTYGSPRIHIELLEDGIDVCVNTVAKLMQKADVRSVMHRKFVPRTTDSQHDHPVPQNVLDRQFDASTPNCKWVCDITYIPTNKGFLYLASVMDLCSRRIVGWQMADHLRTELCTDALQMALL